MAVATRADSKVDAHIDLCAERYARILENQIEGKKDRELIWVAITTGFAEVRAVVLKAGYGIIAALGTVVVLLLRKYGFV